MKKFFLLVIICFICISISGQEEKPAKFTFPKPGDIGWEQLDSPIGRIMSMQIPDSILHVISTKELLDLCLDFPYIIDLAFSDNYQKGIEILISEFNGFKELLRREDAVTVLEEELETIPGKINSLKSKTDVEKGKFSFKCFFLELFIAQDAVLYRMNKKQVQSIYESLNINISAKKSENGIFGEINDISSSLILAKMALKDSEFEITKEQREELTRFINAPSHLNPIISECLTNYKTKTEEKYE